MATLVMPRMPANKPGDDAERQRYQKGAIALGARVCDERGWGIGYSIGLSGRDVLDTELVWVVPRGKPLRTVGSGDLIGVNLKGEVVVPSKDGREVDPEWLPLHLAVYNARPNVHGITTGHTPHARAFAAKGKPLQMLWQDACAFYNTLPVCAFNVAANAGTDPQAVARVLGDKGVGLVIANRGLLTCAATVEGAVAEYIMIESLAGNQLLCEAAIKGRGGELVPIGEEEILFTQKNTASDYGYWFQGKPYYDRVIEVVGTHMEI